MSEESTTPDRVELMGRAFEAANRRDLDAVASSFAEDATFDGRALGDHFEGRAAIRSFLEDWFGAYEELEVGLEEVRDLGNGVVFAVVVQSGRPAGSAGRVRQREGWVFVWVRGLIARLTISEVDEARAAAERLAEEREQAMSQENVEIVRRVMQRYADQDIDIALADMDPEVEFDWSNSDAPDSGVYTGHAGVRAFLEARDDALEERRLDFVQVIAPAPDTVVYTARMRERGRASGVEVTTRIALVYKLREGKIIRLTVYQTGYEALKAVGLAE